MKFQLPEEPSQGSLDDIYYLDYLQRLYRHIRGDTDWIAPSLQNSWVDYGGGFLAANYRLKNGIVYITGVVKNGTTTGGTAIFNLPSGYRPSAHIMKENISNGTIGRFDIRSDGDVVIQIGGSNYFSLHCSFIAEQ